MRAVSGGVEHYFGTATRTRQSGAVGNVAGVDFRSRRAEPAVEMRTADQCSHAIAALDEVLHQQAADETTSACNQRVHSKILSACGAPRIGFPRRIPLWSGFASAKH